MTRTAGWRLTGPSERGSMAVWHQKILIPEPCSTGGAFGRQEGPGYFGVVKKETVSSWKLVT